MRTEFAAVGYQRDEHDDDPTVHDVAARYVINVKDIPGLTIVLDEDTGDSAPALVADIGTIGNVPHFAVVGAKLVATYAGSGGFSIARVKIGDGSMLTYPCTVNTHVKYRLAAAGSSAGDGLITAGTGSTFGTENPRVVDREYDVTGMINADGDVLAGIDFSGAGEYFELLEFTITTDGYAPAGFWTDLVNCTETSP
jgi:hypothetical protein